MLVHFLFALFVPALAIDLACDEYDLQQRQEQHQIFFFSSCIALIDSFVNLSVADEAIVEQQVTIIIITIIIIIIIITNIIITIVIVVVIFITGSDNNGNLPRSRPWPPGRPS